MLHAFYCVGKVGKLDDHSGFAWEHQMSWEAYSRDAWCSVDV